MRSDSTDTNYNESQSIGAGVTPGPFFLAYRKPRPPGGRYHGLRANHSCPMTTSDFAADSRSPTLNAAAPRMAYHLVPASRELPRDVLFAVTFGTSPRLDAPASAHV